MDSTLHIVHTSHHAIIVSHYSIYIICFSLILNYFLLCRPEMFYGITQLQLKIATLPTDFYIKKNY